MELEINVGEIIEKKTLIGKKVYYEFDGTKYNSQKEAEEAKQKKIIAVTEVAKQEAFAKQKEDEYQLKLTEYNKSPEYITKFVECDFGRSVDYRWFSKADERSIVNLHYLSSEINKICAKLHIDGYEIISITQTISGVGTQKRYSHGTKPVGGAGWGYSFTSGVLITAKKYKTT